MYWRDWCTCALNMNDRHNVVYCIRKILFCRVLITFFFVFCSSIVYEMNKKTFSRIVSLSKDDVCFVLHISSSEGNVLESFSLVNVNDRGRWMVTKINVFKSL